MSNSSSDIDGAVVSEHRTIGANCETLSPKKSWKDLDGSESASQVSIGSSADVYSGSVALGIRNITYESG